MAMNRQLMKKARVTQSKPTRQFSLPSSASSASSAIAGSSQRIMNRQLQQEDRLTSRQQTGRASGSERFGRKRKRRASIASNPARPRA